MMSRIVELGENFRNEVCIEILKNEKECVERQGTRACPDRDCANCELVLPTEDVVDAYNRAIAVIQKHKFGSWVKTYYDHGHGLNLTCSKCDFTLAGQCVDLCDFRFCPVCGADNGEVFYEGSNKS